MKKIKGKLLALILCFVMIGASATPAVQTFAANEVKTPAKVSSLKEKSASATSIDLSWKKAKNCTGYEIYTSTKQDSGFKKLKRITKNSTTTYTMKKASGKKLAANKTYYVKVRAINKSGSKVKYGDYSSVLAVYTSPAKTSSLKCTDYDESSISVAWKKVTGATGYYVVVYDSDGEEADDVDTKKLAADFEDLSEGESYTVKVSAYKQVKVAGKTLKLYSPEKSLTLTLPGEASDDDDFDVDDDDNEDD